MDETRTGSTNAIYVADRPWEITSTGSNAAEIQITKVEVSGHEDLGGGYSHCRCKECESREALIQNIWKEYCLIKDAAKWWREKIADSAKVVIEYLPGSDPIFLALMAYQEHLGRPLYEDGVPMPEPQTDEGSVQ